MAATHAYLSWARSSRHVVAFAVTVAIVGLQQGCSRQPESPSADTATTEQVDTSVPAAPPAAPPADRGLARVKVKGEGVEIDGEFPATRCGEAAMGTSGVIYETRPDGWNFSVVNWDHRIAGLQEGAEGGKSGLILNGPNGRSFTSTAATGAEIVFGPDFKSATVTANVKASGAASSVVINAEFTCR